MNTFLSDPNVQIVTLGVMLLGAGAGVVGTFTMVRKRSLLGDAIAHAVLPGVCLAFMLSGRKDPLLLLAGAILTGWLSLLFMDFIVRHSKLKSDAAIGAVLSLFFGLGILLLTAIQNSGSGNQAGLDKFLFGKAASLTRQDVLVFGMATLGILAIVAGLFKAFKLVSFDRDFAAASGLPVRFLEFLLSTITVVAVAVGIQAVGVVLMAALLITPAAAARFWTDSLWRLTALAAIFGIISGFFGAWISYAAPAMPTGPWIVVLLSGIAVFSAFAAPRRGIWAGKRRREANVRKILLENILKAFYRLEEAQPGGQKIFPATAIRERGDFSMVQVLSGLKYLRYKGLVRLAGEGEWSLTADGAVESRRVVRLHRLWELYLSHKMGMAADHVHESAEAMEHLLTPEMERRLIEELDYPALDPHHSAIPYESNPLAP